MAPANRLTDHPTLVVRAKEHNRDETLERYESTVIRLMTKILATILLGALATPWFVHAHPITFDFGTQVSLDDLATGIQSGDAISGSFPSIPPRWTPLPIRQYRRRHRDEGHGLRPSEQRSRTVRSAPIRNPNSWRITFNGERPCAPSHCPQVSHFQQEHASSST